MLISTKGKPKHIKRKELKKVANFFADILLGRRLSNKITLIINSNKELENTVGKPAAYCECLDDKHRDFQIQLCSFLEYEEMIRFLGHEMTHVKQFARGELKDTIYAKKVKWKGKLQDWKEVPDGGYEEQPWELEAVEMEKILLERYLKECI